MSENASGRHASRVCKNRDTAHTSAISGKRTPIASLPCKNASHAGRDTCRDPAASQVLNRMPPMIAGAVKCCVWTATCWAAACSRSCRAEKASADIAAGQRLQLRIHRTKPASVGPKLRAAGHRARAIISHAIPGLSQNETSPGTCTSRHRHEGHLTATALQKRSPWSGTRA